MTDANAHPFTYQDIAFIHNGALSPYDAVKSLVAPKFAELVFGKARHAIKGTKIYFNFVNGHFTATDQAHAYNVMDNYYNASQVKKDKNF